MADMPDSATVKVHIEFDEDTTAKLKWLIREEIAMSASGALTAAVDRRDSPAGL